jgi:hypothetical protein
MNIDYGRKKDLEELAEAMKNAKSTADYEHYEKIAYRILNESDQIKRLREQLIKAMRAGDNEGVEDLTRFIQHIRMRETNGHSWGANRQNREEY